MNCEFLTPHEVAELLRVPPATLKVWRWRANKGAPGQLRFIKIGRLVRYRRADIDEFIAAHNNGTESDKPRVVQP